MTALIAGVMLVVAPYSAALSLELKALTIVDNYSGKHIVKTMQEVPAHRPSTFEVIELLSQKLMRSPRDFVAIKTANALSILRPNGGRLLQLYLPASGRIEALFWKICAHAFVDFTLLLTLVLGPFGIVLARRRTLAALFALWILTSVALAAIGDHGGTRMRAPCEPHLIVLAAVVFAGQWRRASRLALGLSAMLAALCALAIVPQMPRSLRVRGDYGVLWSSPRIPRDTPVHGRAGFNVVPKNGRVTLKVRGDRASTRPARITVRLDGKKVDDYRLADDGWRRLRYARPPSDTVFVELDVRDIATGEPARIRVSRRH
jgi:hypothetical protein